MKNPPAIQEPQQTQARSLSWEDPLEKRMATHSSVLALKIPWMEEPGGATVHWSQRVDVPEMTLIIQIKTPKKMCTLVGLYLAETVICMQRPS